MTTARRYRSTLIAAMLTAAFLCVPAPAMGWANGGDHGEAFGTHDWVLVEASDLVRAEYGDSYAWVDLDEAVPMTDNPDTIWRDFDNHIYHVRREPGQKQGHAPERAAEVYAQVVEALRRGDTRSASVSFGVLSHYVADISVPWHTAQSPDEGSYHSRFEDQVLGFTDLRPRDPEFVDWTGFRPVPDTAGRIRETAEASYADYSPLMDAYRAGPARGMPDAAVPIAERGLSRASGDLADLMVQAAADAGIVPLPAPDGPTGVSTATAEPATTVPPESPPLSWWETLIGWLVGLLGG